MFLLLDSWLGVEDGGVCGTWGLELGGPSSHHQTCLPQKITPSGQWVGTWASSRLV